MIEVGGQAGYVHNQRQGTGLATVLPTGTNSEEFGIYTRKAMADKEAALKAKKAEADAAREALTKFNPDRWFKHETIIQPMMNDWIDKGAQMMAKGQNPWRDVTPEAQAWRKQQLEIEGIANTSKQMKEMADKVRADVNGSDPGAYDLASLQAQAKYSDMDPRDVAKNGILPPPLIKARPMMDLQDFYGKTMAEVNQRRGDVPLNDADRWAIVDESMRNPTNKQTLMPSLQSALLIMPPKDRDALKARADALGKSEIEVLGYDQVKLHEKARKPFDLQEWIDSGVKEISVPYNDITGTKTSTKYVDNKEFDKIALEKAKIMFTDPRALQGYEDLLPRPVGLNQSDVKRITDYGMFLPDAQLGPNVTDYRALKDYEKLLPRPESMNDTDYKALAISDLAKRMRNMKATEYKRSILPSAAGDEDKKTSGMQWLENIKSDKPELFNEATGYLLTAGAIVPGMKVDNAEVRATPDGIRDLVIWTKGKENLMKVKEEFMNEGVPDDRINIEQKGTSDILTIRITPDTENALLRMHDRAYDEMKTAYRGPLEVKKATLSGLGFGKGQTKTTPGAKTAPKKQF
jgi:hypothetical protein